MSSARTWSWRDEVIVALVPNSYRRITGGCVVDVVPTDLKRSLSGWTTNIYHVRDQDGRVVTEADTRSTP